MTSASLSTLISQLIQMNDGNTLAVAEQLGTTTASLSRWRSGNSRPKKQIERRIHSLIAGDREVAPLFVTEKPIDKLAQVELAISGLLEALREEFHRTATLSSRQDVLDLVTVLFFAHVTSIEQGQRGIGRHLKDRSESAAASLNTFVLDSLNKHLQRPFEITSGATHSESRNGFFTTFSAADECFAEKLLEIFESEVESFATLHESGRDDIVNEIFSRFMSTSFVDEKEMGQYLTPPEIVEFMVDLGIRVVGEGIVDHGIILDPSCGVASFLSSTIRSLYSKARTKLTKEQTAQWLCFLLSNRVIGIDKSKRMTKLAELGLALFGAQGVNIYHGNALARTGDNGKAANSLEGKIRLILTNPPFGATYKGGETAGYAMAGPNGRAESEVLFLERYLEWLVPDGVVVSIVPDSVLVNRGSFSRLREWLYNRCHVEAVVSLPSSAFAAAGTSVKTSILVLRKSGSSIRNQRRTFFGTASEIGFAVSTRGGQRRRTHMPLNDLPSLLNDYLARRDSNLGRWVQLSHDSTRWDASFHIGMPSEFSAMVGSRVNSFACVADVAELVDQRQDPRSSHAKTFKYIEISDVDTKSATVGHKIVAAYDAPSRARKLVRYGDVLMSTVRPERGIVGVVPKDLDGAICSTGFAVLRCTDIEPFALAWLLKTEAVRHQVLKHNIGIAYPAIAEQTCAELVLPVRKKDIHQLAEAADALKRTQQEFWKAREDMLGQIEALDTATSIPSIEIPDLIDGSEPGTVSNRT